jgi:hypothetical protein
VTRLTTIVEQESLTFTKALDVVPEDHCRLMQAGLTLAGEWARRVPHRAKLLDQQRLYRLRLKRDVCDGDETRDVRLRELVDLDPEALRAMRQRGLSLLMAGKTKDCKAAFEMLVALGDYSPPTLFVLARCCDLLGELESAQAYFRVAWELEEDLEEGDALRKAALEWGSHLALPPPGGKVQ